VDRKGSRETVKRRETNAKRRREGSLSVDGTKGRKRTAGRERRLTGSEEGDGWTVKRASGEKSDLRKLSQGGSLNWGKGVLKRRDCLDLRSTSVLAGCICEGWGKDPLKLDQRRPSFGPGFEISPDVAQRRSRSKEGRTPVPPRLCLNLELPGATFLSPTDLKREEKLLLLTMTIWLLP